MEIFSALLALCEGNHRLPVDSLHKGQWRGALMFPLICTWTNGGANNRNAGNSRRHRADYDVTVMIYQKLQTNPILILPNIGTLWKKWVTTMVADALSPSVARTSAIMVFQYYQKCRMHVFLSSIRKDWTMLRNRPNEKWFYVSSNNSVRPRAMVEYMGQCAHLCPCIS